MTNLRLLDLFCKAGGAGMGYSRAGFDVTGVDIDPQPNYPRQFTFIQADAMELSIDFLASFDAIHASPPCQAYVARNNSRATQWPRLIEPVRERLIASGVPYVIENVIGAPLLLPKSIVLCGTMFGLLVIRHRRFELSDTPRTYGLTPLTMPKCNHWGTVADGDFAAVYGPDVAQNGRRYKANNDITDRTRTRGRAAPGPNWSVAMGVDWMTRDELTQAVPPAYTKFIGDRLRDAIVRVNRANRLRAGGTSNDNGQ